MGPSPLTLTEAALRHMEEAAFAHGVERLALRVKLVGQGRVVGSPATGASFDLALEDHPRPDDHVFSDHGVRFYIAPDVLPHVRGLVVDYKPGGPGAGLVFRRATP